MIRTFIIIVVGSVFALTATACNTVRGAGADLESAADEVDEEI